MSHHKENQQEAGEFLNKIGFGELKTQKRKQSQGG